MRRRPVLRPARQGITLSEEDGVRYLHFGTEWIQGGMRIARPFSLELEYQRQMMAVALLVPAPQRIVQLGLGAGALAKFCHRHLARAQVVAVDISREVIETARAWFALPADDGRLQTVQADARDFIAQRDQARQADWLQVDLYDAAARGPVYDDVGFYRLCRRTLREPGVACFNLFGRRFGPSYEAIASAFRDRVAVLPEVDEGNRIVLAVAGPRLDLSFDVLDRRAREIQKRWGLPARRWAAGLRDENGMGDRFVL